MGSVMALIAAGIVCAIGYGWIVHLRDGSRRFRATAGGDSGTASGGGYSGTSDGFALGSWFSSSSPGSSENGSCSISDGGSSSGGGSTGGGGGSVEPATTLPGGWASGDIGDVAAAGWATGSGSELAIGGSGADIWGSSDEFRFAYRTLTGDGSIVARVNTIDYYDAWSKGGVMMRESLSPGSAHAFMLASAGKGLAFQRRTSAGGGSSHTGAGGGPGYYVKLVRSGNTFNAYASADGSNWSFVGGDYILMGSTIYVGVAVTSHADGAVAGAGFSGVEVVDGGIDC